MSLRDLYLSLDGRALGFLLAGVLAPSVSLTGRRCLGLPRRWVSGRGCVYPVDTFMKTKTAIKEHTPAPWKWLRDEAMIESEMPDEEADE